MGFFKRAKLLWNKIRDNGKKILRKVITISPKIFNALIKLIQVGDSLGVRKIIINAIPEAGGYINQILDALLQAKELGCVDKIADALKDLMDKKIDPVKFIEIAKDVIQSAMAALRGRITKKEELEPPEEHEEEKPEPKSLGLKMQQNMSIPKVRPKIAPPKLEELPPVDNFSSLQEEEEEEPPKKGTSSIFGTPVNVIQ